jgi:sugar transferase (PEP-CTERM system associated)
MSDRAIRANDNVVRGAAFGDRESPPSIEPRNDILARHRTIHRRAANERRASRYVPNSAVVLALIDYLTIGLGSATVISWIYRRLDFANASKAAVVVLLSVLVSMAFLYAAGCYRKDTAINPSAATSRLPVAIGCSALVVLLILHYGLGFLFPTDVLFKSISRCATFALVFAGIALCAAAASRSIFNAMVRRHWFRRRVLIVGTGSRALHLRHLIEEVAGPEANELYFVSETVIGGDSHAVPGGLRDLLVEAGYGELNSLARELGIDEIVVAPNVPQNLSLEGLLTCKINGIAVSDYHSFMERETGRIDLSWLELSWLVCANGFRVRLLDALLKRTVDILASLLLMAICLPVVTVAAIAIALDSRGSILYRQERVTQGDRRFMVLKLRTMCADAEKAGAQWAGEKDPRITRVGHYLRRWRIDEIPQLINILRGDMSFVGPRPERPMFVEQLAGEIELYRFRHSIRAGLTGWAQVNYGYGASVEDAKRKLEYDLYYIKNYSLLRDFQIILQTMRVVLWPAGVR